MIHHVSNCTEISSQCIERSHHTFGSHENNAAITYVGVARLVLAMEDALGLVKNTCVEIVASFPDRVGYRINAGNALYKVVLTLYHLGFGLLSCGKDLFQFHSLRNELASFGLDTHELENVSLLELGPVQIH